MATIGTPDGILRLNKPLAFEDPSDVPGWRMLYAIQQGTKDNILVRLGGGLGDNVCAVPAIQWALRNFATAKISLFGDRDSLSLFRHLPIHEYWYEGAPEQPDLSKYYVFDSFSQDGQLHNEFLAPPYTHCVDYSTLKLWRVQIPHLERVVQLVPDDMAKLKVHEIIADMGPIVVIHPGRTWPSRTMPKWWWDENISALNLAGHRPILIGSEINHQTQTRGTVDVNNMGCTDLRGRLSVMESVALLQAARVVLTNDSAPLHMAASGNAWIGFLSTVRHPEIVTHYRRNIYTEEEVTQFGWRMRNFAKGGLYQTFDLQPGAQATTRFDMVRTTQMKSWLPEPKEIVSWTIDKLQQ